MKNRDEVRKPGAGPAEDAPTAGSESPATPPGVAKHGEWLLDEALIETFPASDPIAPAEPTPRGAAAPKTPPRRSR